jgi:hypothetical protein
VLQGGASAVDVGLCHARGRKYVLSVPPLRAICNYIVYRYIYLAQAYASVKQYVQALVLSRRAMVHLHKCSSLTNSGVNPINNSTLAFYPLTQNNILSLEILHTADEKDFKLDWFQFNGGVTLFKCDTMSVNIFGNQRMARDCMFDILRGCTRSWGLGTWSSQP